MKKLTVYIATETCNLDKMIEDFAEKGDYSMTVGRGAWVDDNGKEWIERQATFTFLLPSTAKVERVCNSIRFWLRHNSTEQAIAYDVQEVTGGVLQVHGDSGIKERIQADNTLRIQQTEILMRAREMFNKDRINPGCLDEPINHEPGHNAHLGTGYSGHPRSV